MSESMTGKRIWAARTARRFPVIFEMVARGELHLSAIVRLAKHLTDDNHRAVLERARHKSSREIDLLVAELAPRPDSPSRIRALPRRAGSAIDSQPPSYSWPQSQPAGGCAAQRPGQEAESLSPADSGAKLRSPFAADAASCSPVASDTADRSPAAPGVLSVPRSRGQVVALAPRRYKIEITVDQETHDKLRMLQDLLGHQLSNSDPAIVVSCAIDRLVEDTLNKKTAVTDHPRPGDRFGGRSGPRRTRAIPAAIRREVWQRDGGRCTFVDQQGRRCRGTRSVEYHHLTPYGKGGQHEANNIALRCRAHNRYQADLDFGWKVMRDRRRGDGAHSPGNVVSPNAQR